jgi:hypothetical protein
MACIFRTLRSFLVTNADRTSCAVELVHASGSVVVAGGAPLRFECESDAVDFAGRFLCEPHRVVPVEVQVSAAA